MKKVIYFSLFIIASICNAQTTDTVPVFKKRVLQNTEIEFLSSVYKQEGVHSAVNGGIGTEKLSNFASNIVVAIPINTDDVLTFDVGISAYTSASSSNINPFHTSGASGDDDDDDDDDRKARNNSPNPNASSIISPTATYPSAVPPYGTPWQASSGPSESDQLFAFNTGYSHSSDNRNTIYNADIAISNEYDYSSFGFGGGVAKLFNKKNTELSLKGNIYLDKWSPIYPTELHEYAKYGDNFLNSGFFSGVTVLDENGLASTAYKPTAFKKVENDNRNSYSLSASFSQILTQKIQFSLFMDVLYQQGLLATPYQRVYFADKPDFYVGQAQYIPVYETQQNLGVYRLADDNENLPSTRFKTPIGARVNVYVSQHIALRTYYRYYQDNWDVKAHTASLEIPIKIGQYFTAYPMYRYYTQTACQYFAPYETHLSTEKYYTSDYDLSAFTSNYYSLGLTYTDIFTKMQFLGGGIKSIDFRFGNYRRKDGLYSYIFSLGFKFEVD